MTSHEEVELKYDVAQDFELPRIPELLAGKEVGALLTDGGVESFTLQATYFDTAEHVLLHAGWTLRRRTGGADAGWHLKIPIEAHSRHEVRAPLGRSTTTVPLALRRMAWSLTGGAPLVPVARLSTERSVQHLCDVHGQVLADVADDRVEAQQLLPPLEKPEEPTEPAEAMSWREVEVELVNGDRDLLTAVDRQLRRIGVEPSDSSSKLARTLGVHPRIARGKKARKARRARRLSSTSSSADVVVSYLLEQLAQIKAMDPQVRLDRPHSIHEMRVATRRLRTALRAFSPLFDAAAIEPLEVELRWLAGELGAARDAEVLRLRLLGALAGEQGRQVEPGEQAEQQPAPSAASAATTTAMDRELSRDRRAAYTAVLNALNSQRYQLLVIALEELVSDPPATDRAARRADQELRRHVAKSYARVGQSMRATSGVTGGERDHLLHQARKRAKSARYAVEVVGAAFGKPAGRLASAMEALQQALGEHHDNVILRERLRAMAVDSSSSAAFTYGRLHAIEERRQARTEKEISAAWHDARKKSLRAWLA